MPVIGIIATIIGALGALPYIRDAYRKKTKPHRYAWFIFLLVSILNLTSQYALGARASLIFYCWFVANNIIILGLSLRKNAGYGDISWLNILSLLLAVAAIVVWKLTSSPLLALVCVLLADVIGAVFITVKAYRHPHSETMSIWAIGIVATFLNLFAVGSHKLTVLAAPVYVFSFNIIIVMAILLGRHQKHT